MILRPYQQRVLDDLWAWWMRHPDGNPIVDAAVGAGKSLMIAALAQRAHAEFAGTRVLVLVHQKELLEQNLAKLRAIWPGASAGVYSASLGMRQLGQQITFATIGSVWRRAYELGRIDIVLADECHLISPKEAGMWRLFLRDLARTCPHARTVGWTGTPWRGNGVWLTAGDEALFSGIAARVPMRELLDAGFLSPLRPATTALRIEAGDARVRGDDYVTADLAKAADKEALVEAAADEIVRLAADRRRWLVFAVTVEHAGHVSDALTARGVACAVVSAKTPKAERDALIGDFRSGRLRCLVNVAVLTTGFDVPEVDCIALLRTTKSPVLYNQIAGRGMRLAEGKADCLWLDFTETTLMLGPVDKLTGRMPSARGASEAPYKLCPECGSRNPTGAAACQDCGFAFPEPERVRHDGHASDAAVLSDQEAKVRDVPVSRVAYGEHSKPGSPPSMKVDYFSGLEKIASEWVCFDHQGYARLKAERWWRMRATAGGVPSSTSDAIAAAQGGAVRAPTALKLDVAGRYANIIGFEWGM